MDSILQFSIDNKWIYTGKALSNVWESIGSFLKKTKKTKKSLP